MYPEKVLYIVACFEEGVDSHDRKRESGEMTEEKELNERTKKVMESPVLECAESTSTA